MNLILIIAALTALTAAASLISYSDVIVSTYIPIYREACRHEIVPDIGLPVPEDRNILLALPEPGAYN